VSFVSPANNLPNPGQRLNKRSAYVKLEAHFLRGIPVISPNIQSTAIKECPTYVPTDCIYQAGKSYLIKA